MKAWSKFADRSSRRRLPPSKRNTQPPDESDILPRGVG
jgi:hypothetical protein